MLCSLLFRLSRQCCVVSIACDLLNKLAIRLEDRFVSASEVYAVGKISQRLVAYPARSSPSR